MRMQRRLPEIRAILQVYAVIATLVAAWTILAFLWKLSAWLLLLNLSEIFAVFAYAMAVNFLESLVLLFLLLLAGALLPAGMLRNHFIARGTILAAGIIGALMAFAVFHMLFGIDSGALLLIGPLLVLALTAIVLRFSVRRPSFQSIAFELSDRATVFLFILLPLFVLLSAYAVFRNLS